MEGVTVDLLQKHYSLSGEVLQKECTNEHVREISLFLESWELLAPNLGLSKEQVEAIKRNAVSEEEKRIMVLEKWKETFIFLATYQKLLEAFLAIRRADFARNVCELLKPKSQIPQLKLWTPNEPLLLSRLKATLTTMGQLRDTTNKAATMEEAVMDFVDQSLSEQPPEQVAEQLQKLHTKDMIISKEMLKKAQEKVTELKTNKQSLLSVAGGEGDSLPTTSSEPLFSKETLYHASLCIRAVNVCDAGNYQKFFNGNMKDEPVPGHSFQAVSISRSKQEHFKFLIAQKDENTFYFAFQGVQHLAEWEKYYRSFNEGTMAQSKYFPIRFLLELLNKQCRVVLTGFSFGALLACTIAAQVWDTPFIGAGLLKENLVCIAFGLPYVTISVVQTVVRRRPAIASTLHAVYLEDDPVPQLMSFLDKSWSAEALHQSDDSKVGLTTMHYKMPFRDPTTCSILKILSKLQSSSPDTALFSELKSKLKDVQHLLRDSFKKFTQSTTSYLLSCKDTTGLTWSEMTVEQANAFRLLSQQQLADLDITVFQKHGELQYGISLFEGLLDKPLRYKPNKPKGVLGEVENVNPHVEEVQVHSYGNETAVVVEGSNFWFCYHVSFGGHQMKLPAKDITGSCIQLNVQKELRFDEAEGQCKGKVELNSYFSSKVIKREVLIYQKNFNITTRQGQLAKLTPSQVIELGYLSALLEQHPYSKLQPLSHKVTVFRKFLEDIVKVVPFESIVYAIANGSYETAIACAETLLSMNISEVPSNWFMTTGIDYARQRLHFGYPGKVFEKLVCEYNEFSGATNQPFVFYEIEEEQLIISAVPEVQVPENSGSSNTIIFDLKGYKPLLGPTNKEMAERVTNLRASLLVKQDGDYCSKLTIDMLYPVHEGAFESKKTLKSPLNILVSGRTELAELAKKLQLKQVVQNLTSSVASIQFNQQMLDTLNSIRTNELDTCTSLLGGFMDQNQFLIYLSKSRHSRSETLRLSARPASVGVWALFSLNYTNLQSLLTKCRGEQLLVRILDHVKSIDGMELMKDSNAYDPYAGKLQFMVQGIAKTVTCNTHHTSYSLERQLVDTCARQKIYAETSIGELTSKWSKLFEENVLSLVVPHQRQIIAQWLKWSLMIHNLREELARYTAVGVAGLVNSGKSKLVNALFGIKIPIGTTEMKRTTVPFIYNLDEEVEGLDVVDFPGVDDEDDTIGELADLLLTIAQIILFVVDYKRVNTQSCKKWLERLRKEKVPVLVCLTFGDRLYAEHMSEKRDHPPKQYMTQLIQKQLSVNKTKLGVSNIPFSQEIKFFSFSQEKDSILNDDEGRQRLRDVGIGTPQDVGEWLVNVFRKRFQGQEELANQLEPFFKKNLKDS